MSNKHPHHDLIVQWAADTSQVVQLWDGKNGWHDVPGGSPMWNTAIEYRFKPKSLPRIRVTLADGDEVSWPEPAQEMKIGQTYWRIFINGDVESLKWNDSIVERSLLKFGVVHLTAEAALEHADALRKINTYVLHENNLIM